MYRAEVSREIPVDNEGPERDIEVVKTDELAIGVVFILLYLIVAMLTEFLIRHSSRTRNSTPNFDTFIWF